ncbi:hypothetical protein THTE_0269 [Thermogutta terrifontis]|uniref:Uncharacterized protein n=1 Tax=Thermogutta terrifontis TaxID=1331910 RepID=A0A286RA95_9BACT|nr:hypothetical protein THTE_0269 [Thermogutta terrifontis]
MFQYGEPRDPVDGKDIPCNLSFGKLANPGWEAFHGPGRSN